MLPGLLSMVNSLSASIDRLSDPRLFSSMRSRMTAFQPPVRAHLRSLSMALLPRAGGDRTRQPSAVPPEDYPFYDLVVDEKFLTPETNLSCSNGSTLTRLHPEQQGPFGRRRFMNMKFSTVVYPGDLIRDFLVKNQIAFELEGHFGFGVRYRFVSGRWGRSTGDRLCRLRRCR